VLHGVEGMAQGDVAALLGVSQKAVETRIYRARKQLEQMLGQKD
jgi:RNA polymerase sigma-70 factor (ECF subfamily)